MDKYIINGGRSLEGSVKVERAKNAVLPFLAGAILSDEVTTILDCPKILDVLSMIKILQSIGCKTNFEGNNLIIDPSNIFKDEIKHNLTKELRSSVFMLGGLLSRLKTAKIAYPGGCDIGLRPIDMHLNAFRQLGVVVEDYPSEIYCHTDKVLGNKIYLDFPSVGVTENVMILSAISDGETIIFNPAKEPEIVDLMNFLNQMGAKISGAGKDEIHIIGVKKLHGTVYKPIGDRIEAGTLLVAGAITGGEVEVSGVKPEILGSLLNKFLNNTCNINIKSDIIYLKSGSRRKGFVIETNPYPGFPTDLQAQMLSLACVSEGVSIIRENIFETRFKHVQELVKIGADVVVKDRTAIIKGVKNFIGGEVYSKDLRGGASLVLAGLNAKGTTIVHDIKHVERGYYRFDEKLRSLGGDIKKL